METLFLCSIGPVQDFIATARRSRDLWFGSWLLSELAKAVARYLAKTDGFDALIYPHPNKESALNPGSDFSASNKIVALLKEFDSEKAEAVHTAMSCHLEDLRREAFYKIRGPYNQNLAKEQVDALPEFYWVAVPVKTTSNIAQARSTAEAYLVARKNTRDFKQTYGDFRPKSSLDGIRETVIPEEAYPKVWQSEGLQAIKIRDLFHNYKAHPAEQLSGVDLLKRLGGRDLEPDFPSTPALAAKPFWARLKEGESKSNVWHEVRKIFNSSGWEQGDISDDDSLIYPSRLSEYFPEGEVLNSAQEKLETILKNYFNDTKPSAYYALLIADGDNIGKLFDSIKKMEDQRALSEAISDFAGMVRMKINAEFEGTCIYAGGEDILAYLPLHTVLECANTLEQDFREKMAFYHFRDAEGAEVSPTLSGGIVIVHHLMPLSEVFTLARQAERQAKDVDKKNGLTIILDKRSGAEQVIIDKWPLLIKRMKMMVSFIRAGLLGSGVAYELQGLHRELSPTDMNNEGISKEAVRIIKRKQQSAEREPTKRVPSDLVERAKIQLISWLLDTDECVVLEIALEMIVANEIAKAQDLALMPIEELS